MAGEPHIDRVLPSFNVKDGRVMEELGEKIRVERGRHSYHAQRPFRFGYVAKSLGLLHDAEENVGVEGPLVGLVEDDPRVALELRVYIGLALLTKKTYVAHYHGNLPTMASLRSMPSVR